MTPQTIGTTLDVVKAIGGALIAFGVLGITTEQLNQLVTASGAVALAGVGLVTVALPIVRSIGVRGRTGSIKLAAANLEPGESIKINSAAEAADLPANVVGPAVQPIAPQRA